jgi:hypothetical protein
VIYSAHQPDLLPYSGFWYKMHHADVFDLKIWDQYVNRGYQRRVTMRDEWATIPLEPGSSRDPINVKRLKPEAPQTLADTIRERYWLRRRSRFWHVYGEQLCDEVLSIKTDRLWEFNFRLIMVVRDILGIETPVTFGRPVAEGLRGSEGLISAMLTFPRPLTYLSGTGARVYMGDCQAFTDAGIPVIWSRHEHTTGDSIVTVLMDYEDPMSIVLKEIADDGERTSADINSLQGELIA